MESCIPATEITLGFLVSVVLFGVTAAFAVVGIIEVVRAKAKTTKSNSEVDR